MDGLNLKVISVIACLFSFQPFPVSWVLSAALAAAPAASPLFLVFGGIPTTSECSFLCPQLRRSCGSILVSGCLSVGSSKTVHARVLKFHIWIPHGKIVDARFFSCPSYPPFWSYAPLKKSEQNLMHAISYEPCMLGFWNFIYGFLMEK